MAEMAQVAEGVVVSESVDAAEERIPLATILTYAAPAPCVGFMFFLVSMYLMKFSTDVLLIAPGVMGVIFGVSRLWDGVSDPVAGYLSDRTHTRIGRRRPWLLASLIPIVIASLASTPP
jgi:GPH family glycoside/pentoside/hexuronide:cation symporter